MSGKRRSILEKQVQREIEAELGAEPDFLLLRNSVGQARYVTDDGKEFFVPYGLGKGSPDIVGLLRVNVSIGKLRASVGVWCCFEVKAEEGELSDEQKICHRVWRRFGAFIYEVRSGEEARKALDKARRMEA